MAQNLHYPLERTSWSMPPPAPRSHGAAALVPPPPSGFARSSSSPEEFKALPRLATSSPKQNSQTGGNDNLARREANDKHKAQDVMKMLRDNESKKEVNLFVTRQRIATMAGKRGTKKKQQLNVIQTKEQYANDEVDQQHDDDIPETPDDSDEDQWKALVKYWKSADGKIDHGNIQYHVVQSNRKRIRCAEPDRGDAVYQQRDELNNHTYESEYSDYNDGPVLSNKKCHGDANLKEIALTEGEPSSPQCSTNDFRQKENQQVLKETRTKTKQVAHDNATGYNSSKYTQSHPIKDGTTVLLKTASRANALVAYATIVSSSPKATVGGVEIRKQFYKVRINHPILQDEPLVRPMAGYNKIGDAHAKGTPIAWPSICEEKKEEEEEVDRRRGRTTPNLLLNDDDDEASRHGTTPLSPASPRHSAELFRLQTPAPAPAPALAPAPGPALAPDDPEFDPGHPFGLGNAWAISVMRDSFKEFNEYLVRLGKLKVKPALVENAAGYVYAIFRVAEVIRDLP
ncbi:uncharacterized protein C2845_PM01G44830 [Panicum miliaceum]|uniref:Transposase Tnp1/En/Spm-like domain-containing protein n=1 Tax=Panicum miliaceum TaxID=4540 RepID=A0A3L6TK59_PANMI|nr:uncharacterized protein C2845_PM01G44830 [Panicum miliaceum]